MRLALITVVLLAACRTDSTNESGEPDPEPRSMDEMMAQQADLKEGAEALKEKGLCTPEAIRNAPEPDERFWHCRGEAWGGGTGIKEKLAELRVDPKAYEDYCATVKRWTDTHGTIKAICEGNPGWAKNSTERR